MTAVMGIPAIYPKGLYISVRRYLDLRWKNADTLDISCGHLFLLQGLRGGHFPPQPLCLERRMDRYRSVPRLCVPIIIKGPNYAYKARIMLILAKELSIS